MRINIWLISIGMSLNACVQDMGLLGHLLPYGSIDGKPVARPLPEHTIARGQLFSSDYNKNPLPLTVTLLKRGQERYDIYCAACHGLSGYGNGVIVERGFSSPPSFHQDRLRIAPAKHLSEVIRNGFGAMSGYSEHISVPDSWAIVGYIRALQLSQNVHLENLSDLQRKEILREIK